MTITTATRYFTTDTLTLAAYLISEGFDLDHHESCQVFEDDGNKVTLQDKTVFFFNGHSEISDCASKFRDGQAFGNINAYELNRRKLLGIVKQPQLINRSAGNGNT